MPDECELVDCNENTILDSCDILSGLSNDDNADGIPDECQRGVNPPVADIAVKNRYLSFRPGGAATGGVGTVVQAFRVTAPAYPALVKWVGQPDENDIARLVAEPFYQTWGFADVHVGDCPIVPGKVYSVQGIKEGDPAGDEVFYSDPPTEILTTPRPDPPKWWADVVGAKTGQEWTSPDGIVNMDDIMAAVQGFKQLPSAPPLTWVDISPELPDEVLNFADIQQIVLAFKSGPYPFSDPNDCP